MPVYGGIMMVSIGMEKQAAMDPVLMSAEITVCQWRFELMTLTVLVLIVGRQIMRDLLLLFTLCAVAGFWRNFEQTCDQLAGQTIMKNRCQDWFQRISSAIDKLCLSVLGFARRPKNTLEKATRNYGRPFQVQKYHASQRRSG